MSASPGTNTEYSRGSGGSGGPILPAWRGLTGRGERGSRGAGETRSAGAGVGHPAGSLAVVLVAVLGATLVIVAQFTTLYGVHVATTAVAVKTVGTGPNHAWAPILPALLALLLVPAVYRYGNRVALLALAALGIATLLIALIGDLPDAHATGLVGSSATQFVRGTARPSIGLYLETLGAVLLLVAGGIGLLLMTAPRQPSADPPHAD